MFPGPGKKKSRSDMPKKAGDQCAATGTCKVDGANKVSAKDKQKEFMKKKKASDEDYDKKNKGKVTPKFRTSAQYENGGRVFYSNNTGQNGDIYSDSHIE